MVKEKLILLIDSLSKQLKPFLDKLKLLSIFIEQVGFFVFFEVESVPLMDVVVTSISTEIIIPFFKIFFVLLR